VRMAVSDILCKLIMMHPQEFVDFLDIVVASLLQLFADEDPEVSKAADSALIQLSKSLEPHLVFEVVHPFITSKHNANMDPVQTRMLQGAVRLVARIVQRYTDRETLKNDVDKVIPGLVEAFQSEVADLRKAVVFCLVDLYVHMGDDFTVHLQHLTTSQIRLVTHYVAKMHQKDKDTLNQSPPSKM
ncbi:hypothetical protein KIPB_010228, partial [Kipferlia bialata]